MANEVIDLISSSPEPEPAQLRTTSKRPPDGTTTLPSAVNEAPITLSGLTDEFQSTGDIDDSQFIEVPPEPVRNISMNAEQRKPSLFEDIDFLSDDFNTTGDLGEPILVESTGNKRRRISPSPISSGPVGRLSPAKSPARSRSQHFASIDSSLPGPSNGPARRQSLSSNPFASSPKSPRRSPRKLPNQGRSADPFASSPKLSPPRRGKAPLRDAASDREASSDPFASSPRRGAVKTQRMQRSKAPDIEILSSPTAPSGPSRSRRQEWDPISSSAPEAGTNHVPSKDRSLSAIIDINSESNGSEDEDELPDLDGLAKKPMKARSPLRRSRSDIASASRKTTARPRNKVDSAVRAAAKEADKEKKKQERELARQAKVREKERAAALAEVNKMRTDKKISTKEMIVDIPSGLGSKVQFETLLEGLDVEHRTCRDARVVKWRRKVTSRFDEDNGHWEPIPPQIEKEKHIAVVLNADEFVNLALEERVAEHYTELQDQHPGLQLIYLLEGLTPWMRKNRNNRNRQFTSGVRSQEAPSAAATRRKRNAPAEYVSEDIIDDALLELQVLDALIHYTAIPLETAQWLTVLTQHISTIPYKKQRDQALSAGFCMESGQVRTGDDTQDTYIRMLQEIARVTAPIAYGIAAEFGSVGDLVRGLEVGGSGRLESIKKTVNKEGALSDRTVGQAVSKRMHKVFTGRDETSTDV